MSHLRDAFRSGDIWLAHSRRYGDLYRRLPDVQISDMLLDVEKATGFIDTFTHLRTGAPCKDKIGLLNVLLAEGLNLGLSKMAEAI